MPDEIQVTISQESIQAIVKARIQAELTQALTKGGGAGLMVEKLVEMALNTKVKADSYDYKGTPFLEDLVTKVIQEETKKVFKEWIDANRDKIQSGIHKALAKDRTLSSRLIQALVNTVESQYYVKVDITLPKSNA